MAMPQYHTKATLSGSGGVSTIPGKNMSRQSYRNNGNRIRNTFLSKADNNGNGSEQEILIPVENTSCRRSEVMTSPSTFVRAQVSKEMPMVTQNSGRFCKKCLQPLLGQIVRALGTTYHMDCFTCKDCYVTVASKFFSMTDSDTNQVYPLCETDYFRRLDLLCNQCGLALRGSFVTALDKKYHVEHFTCSLCSTVFGPHDSYYEHEKRVYCHFHYSTMFANRCYGCRTAILKQFIEICRSGKEQQWHPECYMINKFWGVCISYESASNTTASSSPTELVQQEQFIESKVHDIWQTLSAFEESAATCISDMLLHVSGGHYSEGIDVAEKFIMHISLLFDAISHLDEFNSKTSSKKPAKYLREAKMLCKKTVAFFALLNKARHSDAPKLGVTQELLGSVTSLAHYLKSLIRIGLSSVLQYDLEHSTSSGLDTFLDEMRPLQKVDNILNDSFACQSSNIDKFPMNAFADLCAHCGTSIESECFVLKDQRWHLLCLSCAKCKRSLADTIPAGTWDDISKRAFCASCSNEGVPLAYVSTLTQYVFLLRIAFIRLLKSPESIRSNKAMGSDVAHCMQSVDRTPTAPFLSLTGRSKSHGGESSTFNYNNEDTRHRHKNRRDQFANTCRSSKQINGNKRVHPSKSSRIGLSSVAESNQEKHLTNALKDFKHGHEQKKLDLKAKTSTLTLDDITQIVAVEQAKEQRPNAFKHQMRISASTNLTPRSPRQQNCFESSDCQMKITKKYFAELSALEYFIVSHLAVLMLEPLVKEFFNLGQLLDMIETRKGASFWGKLGMGRTFKGSKLDKERRRKGSFGVHMDVLLERTSTESSLGIGPGQLRVPGFIHHIIVAMRGLDMAVEGVFRKNGNIKRLKELSELIDQNVGVYTKLNQEGPVQLAALLKKFLREMPDPLLTFKLYRLWILSQTFESEQLRRRVLHLTCCLLPKQHRDILEILFKFLEWVASFSHIDKESGSKMDVHNLATVIAPNILYPKQDKDEIDDSLLAIEVVNSLILYNDDFCQVPVDILCTLQGSSLFDNNTNLTKKQLVKRIMKHPISIQLNDSYQIPEHGIRTGSEATPDADNYMISTVRHVQAESSSASSPTGLHTFEACRLVE